MRQEEGRCAMRQEEGRRVMLQGTGAQAPRLAALLGLHRLLRLDHAAGLTQNSMRARQGGTPSPGDKLTGG
jgi:hypothetical protein